MGEVIVFSARNNAIELAARDDITADPYRTMITRHYRTRDEAHAYLASRGFLFLPSGWRNGRWLATIEPTPHDYSVAIRLPLTA
jgi:hypothetical protein